MSGSRSIERESKFMGFCLVFNYGIWYGLGRIQREGKMRNESWDEDKEERFFFLLLHLSLYCVSNLCDYNTVLVLVIVVGFEIQ